jgi:hypothetical protein
MWQWPAERSAGHRRVPATPPTDAPPPRVRLRILRCAQHRLLCPPAYAFPRRADPAGSAESGRSRRIAPTKELPHSVGADLPLSRMSLDRRRTGGCCRPVARHARQTPANVIPPGAVTRLPGVRTGQPHARQGGMETDRHGVGPYKRPTAPTRQRVAVLSRLSSVTRKRRKQLDSVLPLLPPRMVTFCQSCGSVRTLQYTIRSGMPPGMSHSHSRVRRGTGRAGVDRGPRWRVRPDRWPHRRARGPIGRGCRCQ